MIDFFCCDHYIKESILCKSWNYALDFGKMAAHSLKNNSTLFLSYNDYYNKVIAINLHCSNIMLDMENNKEYKDILQYARMNLDSRISHDTLIKEWPEIYMLLNPLEAKRSSGKETCAICMQEIDYKPQLEPCKPRFCNCKQWYHKSCLEEYFKTTNGKPTCPVCRKAIY